MNEVVKCLIPDSEMMLTPGAKKDGEAVKIARKLTEEQLQNLILDTARSLGYTERYHPHDSRRSAAGFPDLVLGHREKGRVLFIEVKREDGIVTEPQNTWQDTLAWCDQEVYLFRPEHWESGEIQDILMLPCKPNKGHRCHFCSAVVKI